MALVASACSSDADVAIGHARQALETPTPSFPPPNCGCPIGTPGNQPVAHCGNQCDPPQGLGNSCTPGQCGPTSVCPPGTSCQNACLLGGGCGWQCFPVPGACSDNSQCQINTYCASGGVCRPLMAAGQECDSNFTAPNFFPCQINLDCVTPDGSTPGLTNHGHCHAVCTSASQCCDESAIFPGPFGASTCERASNPTYSGGTDTTTVCKQCGTAMTACDNEQPCCTDRMGNTCVLGKCCLLVGSPCNPAIAGTGECCQGTGTTITCQIPVAV